MPIIVRGSEISIHKEFYTALTRHSDSLALSQLWVCAFNMQQLRGVGGHLEEVLNRYEVDTWNTKAEGIKGVADQSLNPAAWSKVTPHSKAGDVYLFVQGISFIPDGLNVSRLGPSGVGATKGIVSDGRLDLNASNITFLETNISFIDGFIRPWSVAVAHRSPKDPRLRCDIELFALQKWSLYEPLEVRKSMVFKNAFPINIDAEEYNYTGDKIINRQVQFAFDRYETHVYSKVNSESITRETVLTLSGQKEKSGIPGLLQSLDNALGTAARVTNRVQGAVEGVTSSVAQGLHAVGLDKEANSVSRFNNDFREDVLGPVVDVLSTGQGAVNAAENIGAALGNVTGTSRRNTTRPAPNENLSLQPEREENNSDNVTANQIDNVRLAAEDRETRIPFDEDSVTRDSRAAQQQEAERIQNATEDSTSDNQQQAKRTQNVTEDSTVNQAVEDARRSIEQRRNRVTEGEDIITLEDDDFEKPTAPVGKPDNPNGNL